MSYEKVKQAKKTIIGMKQTVKAIKAGKVTAVIIAQDTDQKLLQPLLEIARNHQVSVHCVASRKELGDAADIAVGTSVVALTEL